MPTPSELARDRAHVRWKNIPRMSIQGKAAWRAGMNTAEFLADQRRRRTLRICDILRRHDVPVNAQRQILQLVREGGEPDLRKYITPPR